MPRRDRVRNIAKMETSAALRRVNGSKPAVFASGHQSFAINLMCKKEKRERGKRGKTAPLGHKLLLFNLQFAFCNFQFAMKIHARETYVNFLKSLNFLVFFTAGPIDKARFADHKRCWKNSFHMLFEEG